MLGTMTFGKRQYLEMDPMGMSERLHCTAASPPQNPQTSVTGCKLGEGQKGKEPLLRPAYGEHSCTSKPSLASLQGVLTAASGGRSVAQPASSDTVVSLPLASGVKLICWGFPAPGFIGWLNQPHRPPFGITTATPTPRYILG